MITISSSTAATSPPWMSPPVRYEGNPTKACNEGLRIHDTLLLSPWAKIAAGTQAISRATPANAQLRACSRCSLRLASDRKWTSTTSKMK